MALHHRFFEQKRYRQQEPKAAIRLDFQPKNNPLLTAYFSNEFHTHTLRTNSRESLGQRLRYTFV